MNSYFRPLRRSAFYTTETDEALMAKATNIEPDRAIWGETVYIGEDDAKFKAKAQLGTISAETLDRSSRGNGVILFWWRGKGEVFTAGTCEWFMGLICKDQQVERITRNALNRFLAAD